MKEVLLNGFLSPVRLKRAQDTIEKASREGVGGLVLVVNSTGGDVIRTKDLITKLKELESGGLTIASRIELAKSAAALLVLSVGSTRVMHGTGSIHFHRGTLILDANEFDHETGVISEERLAEVQQYDTLLVDILERYGLTKHPKLMSELYGSGWLSLRAETCLRLGLVDRLI
jgi:ATP-dependent protease ClpP protease subunit